MGGGKSNSSAISQSNLSILHTYINPRRNRFSYFNGNRSFRKNDEDGKNDESSFSSRILVVFVFFVVFVVSVVFVVLGGLGVISDIFV